MTETKTVEGRGQEFVNTTVRNHLAAGYRVERIDRLPFGRNVVVFVREPGTVGAGVPPRPDRTT